VKFCLECFSHICPHRHALTFREVTLLDQLTNGLSYREIGNRLGLSYSATRVVMMPVYRKLNVHSKSEAIVWAIEHREALKAAISSMRKDGCAPG
jgi:DNA-binding NarL/FixJ family response regulator